MTLAPVPFSVASRLSRRTTATSTHTVLFTILTTTENAIPAIAGVGSGVSIVVGFRVCVGVDVYVGVGVRFGLGVGVDVCVGVDVIVGVGVGVDAVTDTSSTKPSLRNPFVLKYDP